ncbi:quinol oxidase [Crenobacter luteus]|uniref:quinol oxidase n=1 Tax=Crenobacter luteus TaxID=1452487 RepID=UPI001A9D9F61|nr:quinol oxidase [Crenobacter luteus]
MAATAGAEIAPVRPAPGADGAQRVDIVGGSYYFRPAHVVVKAGQPVELSVRLEGMAGVPHRFVLEGPDGQRLADLTLGEQAQQIRFTPTATGRYLYYCPNRLLFFRDHRQRGMAGQLDVEE